MCRSVCYILFLFLAVESSFAQGNLSTGGDCTITVYMKNPVSRKVTVDIRAISLTSRLAPPNQKALVLDGDNKGVVKISLKGPSVIQLMSVWPDSTINYIAIPGVNIVVHLDGFRRDTAKYSDVGPDETAFYRNIINQGTELLRKIPQHDPVIYIKRWEEEYDAMQQLIADAKTSGMSPAYTSWISESVLSLFKSRLCRQFFTYVTMTRQWPPNIESYIGKVDLFTAEQFDRPGSFTRETDKELAESYYLYYSLIQQHQKRLPAPGSEETYRSAIGYAVKIQTRGSRDIMLRYLVSSGIAHTTDTGFLDWMTSRLVFDKNNDHLKRMIGEKRALLSEKGRGKPAPYFEAVSFSGNGFSYDHYKGKYLFIDIWATWCVPCRIEISYLEELKHKYAGKPIEFISVSTDSKATVWKKFVEATDTAGQFLSTLNKTTSIGHAYKASLIPAFVLIDPQGNIVNPASFRPSDPALSLLLDSLLIKNTNQFIQ